MADQAGSGTTSAPDFASASVPRHLVRGVLGFGAFAGAIALVGIVGPAGLLLAPLGLIALRGCPTCWTIGLMQTISAGRLKKTCVDGRCELTVAGRAREASESAVEPGPDRRPGRPVG